MQYDSPLCLQTGLPLRPHTLQGPAGLRSATLDELEVGVGNFLGQGHRGEGGNGELPARRVCRLERRQLKTPERCLQISGVRPVSRLGWVAGSAGPPDSTLWWDPLRGAASLSPRLVPGQRQRAGGHHLSWKVTQAKSFLGSLLWFFSEPCLVLGSPPLSLPSMSLTPEPCS